MIIPINLGQPEITLRVREVGCNGGTITDWQSLQLIIEHPFNCGCEPWGSPWELTGCWPGINRACDRYSEIPAVGCTAIGRNDDGDIIFRLDDNLYCLPPGRYIATVRHLRGNCSVDLLSFDIDLNSRNFIADRVSVNDPAPSPSTCGV